MALALDKFASHLARSRLYRAEEVKKLQERWLAQGPSDPQDAGVFARWLVEQRLLTDYQAALLRDGHTDNFFLGQYQILDRIGKGRMAGVYKAQHESGQVVAIKVLPPSRAKDPTLLARFQREAYLAMQFDHPIVVKTFHFGEARGLHYLVMEFLEGCTLESAIRQRGKLPYREAARLGFLIALGLQHIHEKGVVHRDLKPSNIMLCPAPSAGETTAQSMIKILDIGLGRELFDPKSTEPNHELTNEGTILGTPDYLAPEQARDARRADIRADIYSLGCSLYRCLTGQTPFSDTNPVRLILKHAKEAARPIRELNPEVPEGVQDVVEVMMAKEPGQRYQTPGQAAEALRPFLARDESPKAPDESAELTSYLKWLKKDQTDAPAPAAPPSSPAATDQAAAAAPPPPAAAAPSRVSKRAERKARIERPAKATSPARRPAAPAAPAALPPPAAPDPPAAAAAPPPRAVPVAEAPVVPTGSEWDVEPVQIHDLLPTPFGLGISRDLFMVLSGALGVLAVVFVIWLVSLLFRGQGP